MIDSYWELYIAYIDKCLRDNWTKDIDPHHYRMEWNHTLPQCLFGDQSLGHYLTLRQHAIASALQTLAMKKNCMFGWHKRYLPQQLVELAWPYFEKQCADNGKKTGPVTIKAAQAALTPEILSENGRENGPANGKKNAATNFTFQILSDNGRKFPPEVRSENGKKTGKRLLLIKVSSGLSFEFPSASEAARTLGLNLGSLCSVARGEAKQHKGYTAVYV
jgi:hypothetical protein